MNEIFEFVLKRGGKKSIPIYQYQYHRHDEGQHGIHSIFGVFEFLEK